MGKTMMGWPFSATFANNCPDVVLPVDLPGIQGDAPMLFACAGLVTGSGDLVLKVVNRGDQPERLAINLSGFAGRYAKGVCTELSAKSMEDENSFDHPDRIAPKSSPMPAFNNGMNHLFPSYSVTVLRWSEALDPE